MIIRDYRMAQMFKFNNSTVEPRYNVAAGVHDFGPCCTRSALGVPISATRELLNNSDRRPLHQVHECYLIRQHAWNLLNLY